MELTAEEIDVTIEAIKRVFMQGGVPTRYQELLLSALHKLRAAQKGE